MEKKAQILRVISSVILALILGVVFASIGGIALSMFDSTAFINDPTKESPLPFLTIYFIVSFILGPAVMWFSHRLFHQTKIVYIILLTIGIPVLLLGIGLSIWSYDGFQSIRSADVPGPSQEHAVLGGVMMLMFAATGIVAAVTAFLTITSAALGFWAFKIRAKIPPKLESHSISRQSRRSKVWPIPR